MIRPLKPWAYGPFEVLLHAELHYRDGDDLDRRMSMISFDNAIEVAVTTYLKLHPLQRGNRTYPTADVDKWLNNYHTKVDFFFRECSTRGMTVVAQHDEIIWFHDVRNGQYHIGGATVPQRRELDGVRAAALEVFSVLFEEPDMDGLLDAYIAARSSAPPPPRTDEHDKIIDATHGMVEVCGEMEYTSEVLYSLDPVRYREVALELLGNGRTNDDGEPI